MVNEGYEFVSGYSVAPYNFVSLPTQCKNVYEKHEELIGHNELSKELLSGYIKYNIVNKTPIIIGATEKAYKDGIKLIKFFKNSKDKYAIPGNSIRGVIRNNASILSLSSLENFIHNERFYFRSFGKGKNRNEYVKKLDIDEKPISGENIIAPHRIVGGYIYKDSKDKYVLVPAKKVNEHSYFIIREQYLRLINKNVDVKYMYTDEIKELINNKDKYKDKLVKKNFLRSIENKKSKGNKNGYEPYYTEEQISFEVKGKRTISRIGKVGEYTHKGYLMCSEHIGGKLAHYVIPEPDFQGPDIVELCNDKFKFIDFYIDDLLRTKKKKEANKLNANDKKYFLLPEKEGKSNGKPIFYGEYKAYKGNEEQIYFGFTPYLRIPYNYSIKEIMPRGYYIDNKFSYVDGIFGFTNRGNKNYKSKVSFEDVVCIDEKPKEDRDYRLVIGEPHASSYPSYLEQKMTYGIKEIKNYNDKDSRIRGIKQYWGKDYITEELNGKKNVSVYIRPLSVNTTFEGKIRFKNLRREELGLILWALKVENNAYETLGYGKAYGFGRVEIENIEIKIEDIFKKYSSMIGDYFYNENKEKLIEDYKRAFKERFNNIDIEEQESVKEFKILKTLVVDRNHKNDARYMMLEYKIKLPSGKVVKKVNEFNQLYPLPNVKEFLKILDDKRNFIKNDVTSNHFNEKEVMK